MVAVGVAWLIRFGTDDSWISFNYARSLVRGDGLTWFGEHLEGYTNFLWVLWVAAGLAFGVDPLAWAWAGSLAALAAALWCTFRIVRLRSGRDVTALTAIALLATNFTFLAFGTSGLETMLQTALVAALWWQTEAIRRDARMMTARRLGLLSVTAALAIMTRLDSAVICAVLGVAIADVLVRRRAGARAWLAVVTPAAVLVGSWLGWKLSYYGAIVPNTAHAKLDWSSAVVTNGAHYLAHFLHAYLLWPVLLLAVVLAIARRSTASALPAAIAIAWSAYVVAVGGDFMEFRFFVPIIPALVAIMAEVVTTEATHRSVPGVGLRAAASVALLASASWHHAATIEPVQAYDSIGAMATFYDRIAGNDWSRLGAPLQALAGTGATLACQSAGAIPYYADLPTIDQLGLNDAWVARHGDPAAGDVVRPGHQRYAPLSYLVERRVSFVIAASQLVPHGALPTLTPAWIVSWITDSFASPVSLTGPIDVVAVPLSHETDMLLWYLTPSAAIDARLAELGWTRRRLLPAEYR